jgi:nucleotide sugar dehydrogenase
VTYEGKVAPSSASADKGTLPPIRETVCIIGLGYVGLTLAAAMAQAGYRVQGVERVAGIRDAVNAGHAHFSEPGLNPVIAKLVKAQRLAAVDALPPAGEATSYIITVGTPLTKDGVVNLAALEDVLEGIAAVLRDGDLVILRSTVKSGTTRNIAKRILDETGRDYDLAFCPERTLEGKALKELTELPQIVGADTPRARARARALFEVFAPNVIEMDRFEAAELVKLVNNTHRDLMFAFANEVAEMCDALGLSVKDVLHACCTGYPRSKLSAPGPVGGPCLEKDPHILAEGLREANYIPRIALAGRRLNEELPRASIAGVARALARVGKADLGRGKVVILGLAFKGNPATDDLRGTMAQHILDVARARWPLARYHAYDAVVPHGEFARFNVTPCATLEEAFDGASLVLIQNNHSAFAGMDLGALAQRMASPGVVYDYWNLFPSGATSMPAGRYYGGLGTLALIE